MNILMIDTSGPACGVAVAVALAWRGRSLLTVAIGACLTVAAAQGVMMLF